MMNLKLTRNEKLAVLGIGAILLIPKLAGGITGQASKAVISAAGGVITGTVTAIGQQVGVPETNMTKCQMDLMKGDKWNASFDCPALDYLRYLANGTIPGQTNLQGLGGTTPNWTTLALLGGAVYLMMKKQRKGR